MSALENIRKGLSSSGSTLIVGILIVGLVATFGNFLGTDNAFSNQKVLEINGQDISIQEDMINRGYGWAYDGGTKEKSFEELKEKRIADGSWIEES